MSGATLWIVGCGPAGREYLTLQACDVVAAADIVLGSAKLLQLFPEHATKHCSCPVVPAEALAMLQEYGPEKSLVLLVSGDPGVASLASTVYEAWDRQKCHVIPGISSVQLACAKIGLPWTDAHIVNAHSVVPRMDWNRWSQEPLLVVLSGTMATHAWVAELWGRLRTSHLGWWLSDLGMPGESILELERPNSDWEKSSARSIAVFRKKPLITHKAPIAFVGAGSGDPELLTRKAYMALQNCQCCVWAGSLVNPALLGILPKEAQVFDSASMSLQEIVQTMANAYQRGESVVRLHTGEPSIFGAIGEQMEALTALEIPYVQIPGISSFQAAAAALQVELTAPEVSQAVLLARTVGRTPMPAGQDLAALVAGCPTLCLFLSMARLRKICEELIPFYGADCPAAVVYKASWPEERIWRATLQRLPDVVGKNAPTMTAVILVGRALQRPGQTVSKLYDASFSHGFRNAASNA